MTENMLTRAWRQFWNPPPPKGVKLAAQAQADAASRLVRDIERGTSLRRSLTIERDLSGRRGNGHAD